MYRIVTFGEILWDNLPTGKVPGGTPMNIALHMNVLGHESALISRVGQDEAGDKLIQHLESNNEETKFIQKDPNLETGYVNVIMGEPEGQFYKIAENVAWDNIQINDENIEAVINSKMFVFGTLAARSETSRATLFKLLEVSKRKVFSMNLRSPYYTWSLVETLLHKSDITKLNKSELKELLHWCGKGHYSNRDGLEYLRNRYELDTIIVSLGRKGAIMNRRGEFFHRDGIEIKIVDKVGCGTAFLAAYLHARVEKKEPIERLTYAIAAGAMAAMHAGAANHITAEMLNSFIKEKM